MTKRQLKEIKTISYHDVESRVIELRGKKGTGRKFRPVQTTEAFRSVF